MASSAQVASTQATGAPVDSSYGHADAGTRYDGGGGAAAGAGGGAGAGAVGGGGGSYEDYYDASASGGQAAAETGLAWSRPVMTGVAPKARGGHAAGLVGNLLIVFGGHYYGGGGKFEYQDDVWAVDVDNMTWHNPTCAGEAPPARYGHTGSVVEYKFYVFGGRGAKGVLYNDLWCLDVENWTWERMSSTTAAPTPRFGHAQVVVGTRLVFHGGWDGTRAFDDLWVYDTEAYSWLKPRVAGVAPAPRYHHVMELSADGRIIVFGGTSMNEKGHPKYLRDVKQLNTETMVWGRCRVFGDHPTERGGAATCNISNVMVMFGGWAGVKRCQVCEQPQGASAKGDIDHQPDCPPGKAIAAAGKPAPAAEGDKHPHLYLLNMDTMEWNQPLVRGTMPSRRYNHSISTVDNRLLIFGGWDGNRPLNDVVQLEFMTVSEEASTADA